MRRNWKIRTLILTILTFFSVLITEPVNAEFGDADFPIEIFRDGPKSYHDAWCRTKKINVELDFKDELYGLRDKAEYISKNT